MKTCALVAAADFNAEDFSKRWGAGEFDCIVAVDGGFAYLQAIGCIPDIVLGDFDSLGYTPEGGNVISHPTHKDKSDLELAFDFVHERGFENAAVYGAVGGRLDHTVANLQMCARFAEQGMNVSLVGLDNVVSILVGPGMLQIPAASSGTVSVFSARDESYGVTESGMEYPLENAILSNRTTLGLSNELVGRPATVSVEQGTLFVFQEC